MYAVFSQKSLPVVLKVLLWSGVAFFMGCTTTEPTETDEAVDDPLAGLVDDPGFEDSTVEFPEENEVEEDPLADALAQSDGAPYAPGANNIYFAYDDFQINPEGEAELTNMAQYLQENPNVDLQVAGHADERGTNEYNLALGERRAMAVKSFLMNLGVEEQRIDTISYGEEQPAVPGNDEYAWSQNRRVEFIQQYN